MHFNNQPRLKSDVANLLPLEQGDFEALYLVASDPEIWAQHPSHDRWKKDVFKRFFDEAMLSGGALKVVDNLTGKIVGTTRIYDYNASEDSIFIGFTFYARSYWGTGLNQTLKRMLIDYLFQYVRKVNFQVGKENVRSQIAISRLGAKKISDNPLRYQIERINWLGYPQ